MALLSEEFPSMTLLRTLIGSFVLKHDDLVPSSDLPGLSVVSMVCPVSRGKTEPLIVRVRVNAGLIVKSRSAGTPRSKENSQTLVTRCRSRVRQTQTKKNYPRAYRYIK